MSEHSTPDLGDLTRGDSDLSWKDSQSQGDKVEDETICKDKLFLISLGLLMSLFT
jgi:hypothetical protein